MSEFERVQSELKNLIEKQEVKPELGQKINKKEIIFNYTLFLVLLPTVFIYLISLPFNFGFLNVVLHNFLNILIIVVFLNFTFISTIFGMFTVFFNFFKK